VYFLVVSFPKPMIASIILIEGMRAG
jgi:hypothetical protein